MTRRGWFWAGALLCVLSSGCVTLRKGGEFIPPPPLPTVRTPKLVANRVVTRLLMTSPLATLKSETSVSVSAGSAGVPAEAAKIAQIVEKRLLTVPLVKVTATEQAIYRLVLTLTASGEKGELRAVLTDDKGTQVWAMTDKASMAQEGGEREAE